MALGPRRCPVDAGAPGSIMAARARHDAARTRDPSTAFGVEREVPVERKELRAATTEPELLTCCRVGCQFLTWASRNRNSWSWMAGSVKNWGSPWALSMIFTSLGTPAWVSAAWNRSAWG